MEKRILMRRINPMPFVPSDPATLTYHCHRVLDIQTIGLVGRLKAVYAATGNQKVVVNLSGGRDSVLAFLVTVRAFDYLKWDRKKILAVSLPAWGTDDATHDISINLPQALGTRFWEAEVISVANAIIRATGHEPCRQCLVCENGLARARTVVGMALGFLIGTGDMSEGFKGWCTYAGDQISMYNPNASVPKTMVSFLIRQIIVDKMVNEVVCKILESVLEQIITPGLIELTGEITQKTEDIIGPYLLTDKYMELFVRHCQEPKKIFNLVSLAFEENNIPDETKFEPEVVLKWLEDTYRRHFGNQFKRQAVPDSAKVGFCLDPRGDYRMPSDMAVPTYIRRALDEIRAQLNS